MNKIKSLFKASPIAIVVVGLVITGIASAALVDYLSNPVQADITVDSPMLTGISLGSESWSTTQCVNKVVGDDNYDKWVDSFPECDSPDLHDWDKNDWTTTGTLEIGEIYGGETVTFYTMSENLADAEIKGHEEIRVVNPGITCADFKTITSRFDSIYGGLGYGGLHTDVPGGDCRQINYNTIEIWDAEDESTWGAGETDVAQWEITFQPAALGTYTITYRVVPGI